MIASITPPSTAQGASETTTYSYSPDYQGALLTSVTNALGQSKSYTYTPQTSLLQTATDANGNVTTYNYYPDTRLQSIVYPPDPAGAQPETDYAYPTPNEVDKSQKENASATIQQQTLYDGLGRLATTKFLGGCSSNDSIATETTYDLNGRLYSTTSPHCSAAASSTDGTTYHQYDALSRPLLLIEPDGSTQSWSYNDDTTTFTDESGSSWSRTNDALGRTTNVIEPSSLQTTYSYDGFDNLKSVNQVGMPGETSRARSFSYDSLSRLTSSTNPETGTIQYTAYDGNGNLLSKTDANGTTMQYNYDALNRLTNKSSPNVPSPDDNATFTYDTCTNGVGRLCQESVANESGTTFSYDTMGRVASTTWFNYESRSWQPGMAVLYDLAGDVTQLTYPDGRVVQQAWDGAGRLSGVTDTTGGTSAPAYLGTTRYYPSGALQSATLGNGVSELFTLNTRLQPCRSAASTPLLAAVSDPAGGNLYDRQSFYNPAASSPCGNEANNNGNIYGIVDNLAATGQAFGYDGLNRLASATRPSGPYAYSHTYNYDSFGNMLLHDNVNYNLNYSIDPATNRLLLNGSDLQYYNNGSLASSPGMSYGYTPEGHLRSINNYTNGSYLYNGQGERTLAGRNSNPSGVVWNEYVYLNGQPMADVDNNGNWTDTLYANGEKIAKVASQTPVLHLSGVCGSCGGGASNYFVSALAANLAGYTIQSGDKLVFRQKQNGPVTAGLYVFATDGTNSMLNLFDTQGYTINAFGDDSDTWQTRVVNLSGWAGKQISTNLGMSVEAWTQPGAAWDSWVSDVTLVSVSGVSYPMFNGQTLGGSPWSPGAGSTFAMSTDTDPAVGARYYLDDHLGTTQMELSAGGWPVWQGSFTPFGQEIIGGSTTNYLGQQPQDGTAMRYKFTGKERDTESGLDYFGARYYASNMGRWMSPDDGSDWDPSNPQSWNLYSYVRNNPLTNVDPDGHDCVYLNNAGNGAEEVDRQSSQTECMGDGTSKNPGTGGYWVDGTASSLGYDPNSNAVALTGVYNGQQTSSSYGFSDSVTVNGNSNSPQLNTVDISIGAMLPSLYPKNMRFQFQPEVSYTPWQMLKRMANCYNTDDPNGHIGPKAPEPKASTDTVKNGAASLNMQHQMDKHGNTTGRPLGKKEATEAGSTAADTAGLFNDIANCAGGK